MSDTTDPGVYLTKPQPSPAAAVLVQRVGLHAGAEVPLWMLAEVAVRVEPLQQWRAERLEGERKVKRRAWALVVALAANAAVVVGYTVDRIQAGAVARERAENLERTTQEHRQAVEREIQDLKLDVRELRAAMRRLSGADPIRDSTDLRGTDDKVTDLNHWNDALVMTIPLGTKLDPTSCFQTCNSNVECGGSQQFCKFCNFGECRSTRPETTPVDAGIDAPPGGTTP